MAITFEEFKRYFNEPVHLPGDQAAADISQLQKANLTRKQYINEQLEGALESSKAEQLKEIEEINGQLEAFETKCELIRLHKDAFAANVDLKVQRNRLAETKEELDHIYGKDSLDMLKQISASYTEQFKLDITSIVKQDESIRVEIHFIVDGELMTNYPVVLIIDSSGKELNDIQLKFHGRPTEILNWFTKNRNFCDLLRKLRDSLLWYIHNRN